MSCHRNGKVLSRLFVLETIFLTGKDDGMTISRGRLGWRQKLIDKEVARTMPSLVKRRKVEVKDPTRVR